MLKTAAMQTLPSSPPRPDRRERHRAEMRRRLYRAALDLFAERGFMETTVEDITEAADVGKGTFFNYFPTKEHVLATYGEERVAAIEAALQKARTTKGPVYEVLKKLATSMAGQSGESPALLRAIYAAHASCPPVCAELRKRMRHGRKLMAEIFALAQERGEIRSDWAPADLARLTQTVFMGVTSCWALNPESSLGRVAEEVWELLFPNLRVAERRFKQGSR